MSEEGHDKLNLCPNCGTPIPDMSDPLCPNCGFPLHGQDPPDGKE